MGVGTDEDSAADGVVWNPISGKEAEAVAEDVLEDNDEDGTVGVGDPVGDTSGTSGFVSEVTGLAANPMLTVSSHPP